MRENERLACLAIGYACFIVACTQSFIPDAGAALVSESVPFRIANNATFVASYAVLAVLLVRRHAQTLGKTFCLLPALVIVATQLVFFLCDRHLASLSMGCLVALHALTGCAMAGLFTFWAGTAHLFDARRFRYGILAGSLLSCFVVIFVSASGSPLLSLVSKLVGLLASTVLALRLLLATPNPHHKKGSAGVISLRKGVVRCAQSLAVPCACAGVLGFAYQYTGIAAWPNNLTTLYFTVGEAFGVSIVLLLIMMPEARPFSMIRAFRLLCPFTCLALVTAAFARDFSPVLSVGISSTSFNLCLILLMPYCADLGRRNSLSIAGLYAGAASVVNLFPTLGYILALGLGEQSAALAVVALAACAVVLLVVTALERRTVDSEIDLRISDGQAFLDYARQQSGGVVIGRSFAAAQIAEEYGLSNREREVLEMALRGKTAPQISLDMGISPSTVRTHLRKIFQKTGLHSRGELIDLSAQLENRIAGN